MKGWYFSTEERCLQYGDGRKIVVGKSHSVAERPVLCLRGLHASPTILQALIYAPGPILYSVEVTRHIDIQEDKFCGQRRKYLRGGYDITPVLSKFSRECALSVAHLWGMPEVVREFLTTGDETLRSAARSAAWSAAEAAAAWSAARSAAWSAERSAAWSAAEAAAAWSAARSAVWSAAEAAAWSAAEAAVEATAEAAVEAAVEAAARSAQTALLETLVLAFWETKEKEN